MQASCNQITDPFGRSQCQRALQDPGLNPDTFIDSMVVNSTAGGAEVGTELPQTLQSMIDGLSYISIPLAVLAVVLLGILIIGGVTAGNGAGSAKKLSQVAAVLIGLVIVMNAPQFVTIFV